MMGDTAIRELDRPIIRLMSGTYAPTKFKAVIKHNEKGYFAEVEITLTTSAWISSDAMTRRVFLTDVYQSIADEYKGVVGFTPEFVDDKGRAIVDGLDDLASDVLGKERSPEWGECKSCGEPLTEQEYERGELYDGKCHNCFTGYAN